MAKRFSKEGIARSVIFSINFIFFVLGLIVVILSTVGMNYFVNDSAIASALSSLDLPILTTLIVATGCVTVGLALVGLYAAWTNNVRLLKLYLLALFVIIAIQVAMGIYLLTLDINDNVRQSWNEESDSARERRDRIQSALDCCGFETFTDSMGFLGSNCGLVPTQPVRAGTAAQYVVPQTCKHAINQFVNKWLLPVAIVAIVLAIVELLAVATTAYIIFQKKKHTQKTGFEH